MMVTVTNTKNYGTRGSKYLLKNHYESDSFFRFFESLNEMWCLTGD